MLYDLIRIITQNYIRFHYRPTKKRATSYWFHPKVVLLLCEQKKITTMSKDNQKHLVGQPIFKQIIKLIPRDKFSELVIKCKSDRYTMK